MDVVLVLKFASLFRGVFFPAGSPRALRDCNLI